MQYCPNCGRLTSGRFCQFCGFDNTISSGQTYQRPPLRPLPKKVTAALVFAIFVLILLLIGGALSWWYLHIEGESEEYDYWDGKYVHLEMEAQIDFGLEDIDLEMTEIRDGDSDTLDSSGSLSGDMKDVGDTAGLLMLLGIIMLILTIIFVIFLLALVHLGNVTAAMYTRLVKNLCLLFILLAFIIILIVPIYYMFAWPDAVEDDMNESSLGSSKVEIYDGTFMGSESYDDTVSGEDIKFDSSWGPGLGWIMVIFCLIMLLITLGMLKSGGDDALILVEVTSTKMQQPQYSMGSQQYQWNESQRQYTRYPNVPSYQQQPTQSQPPTEVTCPTCKYIIAVSVEKLPAPIRCPQCGTRGFIE